MKCVLRILNILLQLGSRFIILKSLVFIYVTAVWMIQMHLLWVRIMHRHQHACPFPIPPPPIHPAVYILVYKTCSESLESIRLCGFIKNYQHAMQRVEITIMWCPSDVIAFSILWVFNPHLSPLHHLPSPSHPSPPSTLWNSNHSRIYQWFLHHVFIYWFRIHTHTHTHVRVGSVPKPSPSIPKASAIFLSVLVKWKLKLHCFN